MPGSQDADSANEDVDAEDAEFSNGAEEVAMGQKMKHLAYERKIISQSLFTLYCKQRFNKTKFLRFKKKKIQNDYYENLN